MAPQGSRTLPSAPPLARTCRHQSPCLSARYAPRCLTVERVRATDEAAVASRALARARRLRARKFSRDGRAWQGNATARAEGRSLVASARGPVADSPVSPARSTRNPGVGAGGGPRCLSCQHQPELAWKPAPSLRGPGCTECAGISDCETGPNEPARSAHRGERPRVIIVETSWVIETAFRDLHAGRDRAIAGPVARREEDRRPGPSPCVCDAVAPRPRLTVRRADLLTALGLGLCGTAPPSQHGVALSS